MGRVQKGIRIAMIGLQRAVGKHLSINVGIVTAQVVGIVIKDGGKGLYCFHLRVAGCSLLYKTGKEEIIAVIGLFAGQGSIQIKHGDALGLRNKTIRCGV